MLRTVVSAALPDDTPETFPDAVRWAEIAGLMVTLSRKDPRGDEEEAARYVIVANEYYRNLLVRQNVAVRERDSVEDVTNGIVSSC